MTARDLAAAALVVAALHAAAARAQGPAAARELYVRSDKGHCIACHQLPEGSGPATTSDLGPRLEGTRMRALGKAKLRDLLRDAQAANADTVMPPFGRHRILEAGEIDRLVEFLHALP